ncbi:hypothetical protein VYU27_001207 [Nannochloropsis oceanica]
MVVTAWKATLIGSCLFLASGFQVPAPCAPGRRLPVCMAEGEAPSKHGGLTYNKEKAMAGDINSGNYRKLSDAMIRAEKEAKRNEEEKKQREMAEELARQARAKKVAKLNSVMSTPKQTVGSADEFSWDGGVQGALDKLETELIGLKPVKSRVRELASMLVVDKMRQSIGLDPFISDGLHMCFTGAPGTGKTTVAFRMGDIFKAMGYCRSGHVVLATRDTLVGQYVGHTGPKTKEVIKQAMGGILFIDEAYYLYNAGNDRDYGVESIEILLKVMEQRSSDLIVIFAGYKDRMDQFFSYIPGMQSRVNLHIDFPDMEPDDLVEVGKLMFNNMEYKLSPDAEPALREYVTLRKDKLFFSNARSVRNAVDLARMSAANRVYEIATAPGATGVITLDDLTEIKKEDFDGLLDLVRNASDDAILA